MPRKGANISLSSYDDIFETDESRADRSVNWFPSKTIHSR